MKIGEGTTAPNNVGKNSFPDGYDAVRQQAVTTLADGTKVYVGPSEDPFAIDVGRIFDLIGVGGKGTDNLAGFNVHSIAIQVPLAQIRQSAKQPVIGGWAAVDRMVAGKSDSSSLERRSTAAKKAASPRSTPGARSAKHWVQVERLGQPLINEVIIPRGLKDYWNSVGPDKDYQFEKYYTDQRQAGPADPLAQRPAPQSAPDRRARLALPARPGRPAWRRRQVAPISRRSCCGGSSTRTTPRRRST